MSIDIRAADLAADRAIIIDLIHKNLTASCDEETFEWLYLRHPAGPARAWLAFENESRQYVGLAGAFPRQLSVSGEGHKCWVLGDFCVDARYRSLGPAIQLQRACLEEAQKRVALCYDFPSPKMLAIYKRLQVEEFGRFCRFVKLLRVDGMVSRMLPTRALGRSVSAGCNMLLSLEARLGKASRGLEVLVYEGRFGKEFTDLDREMRGSFKILGSRSAAELNWRYRDRPRKECGVLVVRRKSRLLGYLVFTCEDNHAVVEDVFGEPHSEGMQALLTTLSDNLRSRNIERIHAHAPEIGMLASILRKAGFRRRESAPLVVVFGSQSGTCDSASKIQDWFLTPSDRDS